MPRVVLSNEASFETQRVEGELDEKLGILQQLEATVKEVGRSNRSLSRSQAKVEKRARDEVQAMRLEKETQVGSVAIDVNSKKEKGRKSRTVEV
jgi:uncharacterized protein YoxC